MENRPPENLDHLKEAHMLPQAGEPYPAAMEGPMAEHSQSGFAESQEAEAVSRRLSMRGVLKGMRAGMQAMREWRRAGRESAEYVRPAASTEYYQRLNTLQSNNGYNSENTAHHPPTSKIAGMLARQEIRQSTLERNGFGSAITALRRIQGTPAVYGEYELKKRQDDEKLVAETRASSKKFRRYEAKQMKIAHALQRHDMKHKRHQAQVARYQAAAK